MSGTDGSERRSRSILRSLTVVWDRSVSAYPSVACRRSFGQVALTLGLVVGGPVIPGCRTDQAAQDGINQMRAEQIAIEDRYAALRNEYEKLRNRLAAQGDADAQNPAHPSALPLTYPPGSAPLDGVPSNDQAWDWPNEDFRDLQRQPGETPVPELRPSAPAGSPSAPAGSPGAPVGSPGAPAERPSGSVLEGQPGSPPTKPTRVELDPGQTRVTRSPDGQQITLRMVARTTDAAGQAANPTGTYSLRLLDNVAGGDNRVIGDWNFPAESIRRFVAANGGGQGRAAQVGVPLEVSFVAAGSQATQWLAELEYFPTQGQKLTSRQWVGDATNADPSLPSWVDQLPLPRDGRGLMSTGTGATGTGATGTGSTGDGPSWSPQRQ